MKKSRFAALLAAVMLFGSVAALPVMAEDDPAASQTTSEQTGGSTVTGGENGANNTGAAYIIAQTATDAAGGEIATIEVGDTFNLVLRVADYAAYNNYIPANQISARVNSSVFTFTGNAEISQLYDETDANGAKYYTYVLLFRDVIYNGGGNTVNINLSYLNTTVPMQQLTATVGQCVDKDQTSTPNLVVRTSGYGDVVNAGEAFDLSLGVYATDGGEALNDVIVSLTLPENLSLGGGSLSSYVGTISPKTTRNVSFSVLPAAGFTGTVADITVNMTGTGAITGNAVTASTAISVPVSQPDRFEVGQLELSSDTIYVGDTGSVSLSYVNKGKNPVSNLEARLTGTNLTENYQYLGNLAAGTEGSVDFDLTPEAAGSISGVITLTYEDATGKSTSVTKDFTLTAEEMQIDDYDPSMDVPTEDQTSTGMPLWGWLLIAVCAVAVVVAVVVIVRRRKKAKALAQLEEGSDEDL